MNYCKLTKVLLSATAICITASCGIIDKKDTAEESNWFVSLFEKDGNAYAEKATLAYSNGDFSKALQYSAEAIKGNPRNEQALLVGALSAEKLGRFNKARQYYEDLIIADGNEKSVLGTPDNQPQKISETAKRNLRAITISQSNLTIENRDGTKHFAVSEESGELQSKTTIANALKKKDIPAVRSNPVGIDDIFTPEEQNIVSRFIILKDLAEKDFITKDEFLSRRSANIGGLLPLTRKAPGIGIDQPVPTSDLIIERLNVLKEGVETRAITPREFSAERDIIIEALMSPAPRQRIKNKAPSKNILDAAQDLRKLEILQDLGLITENEKNNEKKAIEKSLGIQEPAPQTIPAVKKQPVVAAAPTKTETSAPEPTIAAASISAIVKENKTTETVPEPEVPDVTSPF